MAPRQSFHRALHLAHQVSLAESQRHSEGCIRRDASFGQMNVAKPKPKSSTQQINRAGDQPHHPMSIKHLCNMEDVNPPHFSKGFASLPAEVSNRLLPDMQLTHYILTDQSRNRKIPLRQGRRFVCLGTEGNLRCCHSTQCRSLARAFQTAIRPE